MVIDDAGLAACFTCDRGGGRNPSRQAGARPVRARGADAGPVDGHRDRPVAGRRGGGDTSTGLASARAAWLRTIAVTTTHPADVVGGADAVVPTLREVTVPLLESLVEKHGDEAG